MLQLPIFQDTNIYPPTSDNKVIRIENRRFLGNKFKLISFIKDVITENCKNVNVVCDMFSGTGVVGHYLSNPENKIIFNDILESSLVPIRAFDLTLNYNFKKIQAYLNEFNNIFVNEDNYFSTNFGNKYFTQEAAKKIGTIRELIEDIKLENDEKDLLLTSLLYATDKIANTVGHYDAYHKKLDNSMTLRLRLPHINTDNNINNAAYRQDANTLIRDLNDIDLLYLDPPYNSRQYSDTYHLLENLVRWEKPEVVGKAAKMNRYNLKSRYCFKDAFDALSDLIEHADSRYILLSYNNTGDKRDKRSNNRISSKQILEILNKKGEVKIFEKKYNAFNSGKTENEYEHKEILYFCKTS